MQEAVARQAQDRHNNIGCEATRRWNVLWVAVQTKKNQTSQTALSQGMTMWWAARPSKSSRRALPSLVVLLVVGHEWGKQSKSKGQEGVAEAHHHEPHPDSHTTQIDRDARAANACKDLVRQGLGPGGHLVGSVEHLQLVHRDLVPAALHEPGLDWAGVDGTHVDPLGPRLDGERARQLRHRRLREAVADGKGVGDEAGGAGREHDGPLQLLLQHL
mmetsp:Transcript_57220/g.94797  ORF Transcript_57220/g.94797 Transcript_57220/m.94797 type:complete len:216 (-) Transcript_57220:528-1175(-)